MFRFLVLVLALVASAYGSGIADRIIGGSDAPDGAYPYQVSLRTLTNSHFCGGSIINERWILTAAHCVKSYQLFPNLFRVVVGTNQLSRGGTTYHVRKVHLAAYDSKTFKNDIAVIKVKEDIVFGEKVQPITLATEDSALVSHDNSAVLTGWGTTTFPHGRVPNNLQHIMLKILNPEDCEARDEWITETNICTLTVAGEGACHGDSGGPLVAGGVQVGIVSWGSPCAVGEADVFTRVSSYSDWINGYVN